MLRLIGAFIFEIGWVVGGIKYRLGVIVRIPERFRRSSNTEVHPETLSPFQRL
jgi:hypothetical protein